MTIRHHPQPETLLGYAAGPLPVGQRLVVAAHLERCAACRKAVAAVEAVGGVLIEDMNPTPMDACARDRVFARIEAPLPEPTHAAVSDDYNDLPAALRDYDMGPWRWMGLGVKMRPVMVPNAGTTSVFLLKGAPGTKLPQHSHSGAELTVILRGSFAHEGGTFVPGDIEEADDDTEHRPIVSADGECLCLVALDGQLRLSGLFGKLINPFIRF